MKQIRSFLLLLLCLLLAAPVMVLCSGAARAVDDSRSYEFELAANGMNELNVQPGDILTFTLKLCRTDSEEEAEVYAVQDEIRYNAAFFELVEGSLLMNGNVEVNDISLQGEERALFVNWVSFSGGDAWATSTILGTFQMKVIGESGSSTLQNENCLVSLPDGSDSYAVSTVDFTALISDVCTVCFDPQNGEEAVTVTAALHGRVEKPEVPVWAGHAFTGWYRDKALSELWDFENDQVTGNMTLYGGWTEDGSAVTAVSAEGRASGSPIVWIGIGLGLLVLLTAFLLTKKQSSGGGRHAAPRRRR